MAKPLSEYLRSISPTKAKSTLPLSSYLSSLPKSTYEQKPTTGQSFATQKPLSEYLKPIGKAIGTAVKSVFTPKESIMSQKELTPLQKATSILSQQKETQECFQKEATKFGVKTAVNFTNFFVSALDSATDFMVKNIDAVIPGVSLVARYTPWGKKKKQQWQDYFEEIHNAGTKYGLPILPTQKLQQATQKLSAVDYLQPSEEWENASLEEKLSKEHIAETILEIGPSVVASIGAFALAGPTVGVSIIGLSTANDVKDSAISYGVDYEKAELLGLSTGIIVSALERIVPNKIFAGNLKIKNKFIGSFAKRLTESVLLEAGTEVTQEGVQMIAEKTFREDLGWDEAKTRFGLSALGGALGGAGMQMIGTFANDVQRKEIMGETTFGLTMKEIGPEEIQPTKAPAIPKELEPLVEEARKYKSAEEFVRVIRGDTSQNLPYGATLRKFGLTEQSSRLSDLGLGINPEKEVVVYRGIDDLSGKVKRRINDGDYVIGDFEQALAYTDLPQNVVTKKVKIKDLIVQHADEAIEDIKKYGLDEFLRSSELVYSDSKNPVLRLNREQLTNFYNQATKGIKEVKPEVKPEAKPEIKEIAQKRQQEIATQKEIIKDVVDKIHSKLRNKATIRSLTKAEVKNAQNAIIGAIEDAGIPDKDWKKFRDTIKNIQTSDQFVKSLPEIEARAIHYIEAETKRKLQKDISKELKRTKPKKVGEKRVAKYDYESNKLFEELRKDIKLTQEQAQQKLDSLPKEDLSDLELVEVRLLSLKANGIESSLSLHQQVLNDIKRIKDIGAYAKDEADFAKRLERSEKIDEVLNGVQAQKKAIPILRELQKGYISSISNLYSAINAIAGRNIADKYDYGMYQTRSQYAFGLQVEQAIEVAKKIYGVNKNSQLQNIFIDELTPANWTITDRTGLTQEINRFNLMDIYNAIKNDAIRERYYNAFGEDQIYSLLQNLTVEDIQLADSIMEQVQSNKEIFNQRSIEITGRDIGSVINYWPSTSEFEADFYDDIRIQGETPSAMKLRAKNSKIIPRIDNAWIKFQRHTAQAEHIKNVSRRYEELKNIFSDRILKHNIKEKFGDDAYNTLMNHIETLSLNHRTQMLDMFSDMYNTALNNWVKAKVASPTVFIRQLISSIYSIEKVGIDNYLKYQAEIIKNPKKAFDYIWKNVPFMESRFKQGYSEALQDAIRGTNHLKVGMDSITKYVTLPTRSGDITAILLNGYPIIKTEMAKHGNMQKAIDEFQKFTEKTQQSGADANLSRLQRERNAFARTFFRFKNTTNQLLRLQTDATIQFANKQITPQQFITKTLLYSVYTPIMYVLMGAMIKKSWKKIFGREDEEGEDLMGDILQQIIIQPFQALPLLDMAMENAYAEIRKRITGKDYYFGEGIFSYPLLSDIETAWSKLTKKEPTRADFLRVLSLIQEPITGIPTETILRYYGYTQKDISDLEAKIKKGTATVEDIKEAVELGYIKDDQNSVLKFIEEAKFPEDIKKFSKMKTDDQIEFLRGKTKEEIRKYRPYANENFIKRFQEWKEEEKLTKNKVAKSVNEYDRNVAGLVSDYAKAFMTDPKNAFKALLTKEKLGKVEGNLVELQRFYGIFFTDEGGSQEYKKKLMEEQGLSWDDKDKWKLEHIVPVSAGGDNSNSNLMLVNKETHDFFTPIDIAVGNAVKDKRITRKEASQLMKDFKINKTITAEEVMEKIK